MRAGCPRLDKARLPVPAPGSGLIRNALAILLSLPIATAGVAAPRLVDVLTPVPPPPPPLPAALVTGAPPETARGARGFEIDGFIERATVTACEPDSAGQKRFAGGFVWVNGSRYTIPCNTMVLLPGITISWGDLFGSEDERPAANLALAGDPHAPAQNTFLYPATPIHIVGNIVGGAPIAGLVSVAQKSGIRGEGFITSIDYKAGRLGVGNTPGGSDEIILELNDPPITDPSDPAFGRGRYSAGQSADARFAADQSNQTIRSVTGYPMCVPRIDPAIGDDVLCPQRNRPSAVAPACRSLGQAGIFQAENTRQPAAANPTTPWCTSFVMKYPPGTDLDQRGSFIRPDGNVVANAEIASPGEPDSRFLVPFKTGDFITFIGTQTTSGQSPRAASSSANPSPDVISVHTIEANVGIYTAPGSLPAYAAITSIEIAADPAPATAATESSVVPRSSGRISLRAVVSDPTAIADLYFVDLEPGRNIPGFPRQNHLVGDKTQRWITPNAITGEVGAVGSNSLVIGGGISAKPRAGRYGGIELLANKVNNGVLVMPTRYVRLVLRSLCDPANINGRANVVPANGTNTACLLRARTVSGFYSGQYLAPVELLFPESTAPGEPRSPKELWSLGFLVNGEGGNGRGGEMLAPGALWPTPW